MACTTSDRPMTCQQCPSPAKYTCPGCLTRSCSLPCIRRHKELTRCTGLRDRVRYKPMSQLDDLDILNDYRLLEEMGRRVEVVGRAAPRSGRHGAPPPLRPGQHRLRRAAGKRGVRLDFLPEGFERRRLNTTELEGGGGGRLLWRVEWRLPLADTAVTDDKVPECRTLSEALERHLSATAAAGAGTEDRLQFYRAAFETGCVRVFLRLERVQQGGRFAELALGRTLADSLRRRTVIEFPVLVVTTEEHAHQYRTDTIDESFFSLCRQEEEGRRRARRAQRRRRAGPVSDEPDQPARKVPPPRLDGVPVATALPGAPAAHRLQEADPAPGQTPETALTGQTGGAAPPDQTRRGPAAEAAPTPAVQRRAAAGFGLFGADDSDLSDSD